MQELSPEAPGIYEELLSVVIAVRTCPLTHDPQRPCIYTGLELMVGCHQLPLHIHTGYSLFHQYMLYLVFHNESRLRIHVEFQVVISNIVYYYLVITSNRGGAFNDLQVIILLRVSKLSQVSGWGRKNLRCGSGRKNLACILSNLHTSAFSA